MKYLKYIFGLVVFAILSVIGFIYTTVKHIIKLDYSFTKQFYPILKSITLAFDGMANSSAGELLNDLNLKQKKSGDFYKNVVKYGKWYHTISGITGVNKKRGVLNKKIGQRFNAFLDLFLGYMHSILAINKCIDYDCKE